MNTSRSIPFPLILLVITVSVHGVPGATGGGKSDSPGAASHSFANAPTAASGAATTPDSPSPDEATRAVLDLKATRPESMSALERLGVDVWSIDGPDRATVLATSAEKAALQKAGFEVLHERPLPPRPTSLADSDGYRTFDEYVADMRRWAADRPDIVSLSSIGKSHEGRDIWLLKVSDRVAVDEDEPEVLLLGLQHAREWLGGMTLHGIAQHLIEGHGTDPEATELVDSLELYFVLVANPDGYVYTHTTDRYWRKNRRDNGDGTYGVDLNRNFPFKWSGGPTGGGSTTYGGPSPLSEPEDQAVVNWVLSRPKGLAGCLNYHTYGTHVMHNWAYTYALPPNTDWMGPLAREVAFAIESVNGQRMLNGSWSITLNYTGTGATIDYFQATLGIPTLTLELRPGDGVSGDFAPPGSMIAPSVSENIAGCETFLRRAVDWAEDPTSPTILNITISGISNTRATVSWDTDDPSDRAVEYGTTLGYGFATAPDRLRGIHHEVTLTGLSPDTLYHARARAENLANLVARSDDFTFRTTAQPQDLTPPSPPVLQAVRRGADGRVDVRWTPSPSVDVAGYRLYETFDDAPPARLLDETTLAAGATGAALDFIPPGSIPRRGDVRSFYLTAIDRAAVSNESVPSDTYAVSIDSATSTTILIVDGYDRWNSRHESQGDHTNHAFAADHGRAVAPWGLPFDTCANEALGGLVPPADYSTLIWVLGDESTADQTFAPNEQTLVQDLLERGGNLFVSGADVAYDLDGAGASAADRTFLHTFFFAQYARDNTAAYDVHGTGPGTLFDRRLIRFDDGSRGIYRVNTPDAVTPLTDGEAILTTPAGSVCGIARTGLFGVSNPAAAGTAGATAHAPGNAVSRSSATAASTVMAAEGRLVYFCFPFETIFPASARMETMGTVLEYFGLVRPSIRNGLVAR